MIPIRSRGIPRLRIVTELSPHPYGLVVSTCWLVIGRRVFYATRAKLDLSVDQRVTKALPPEIISATRRPSEVAKL